MIQQSWALFLDESARGDVLTVGGFMARADRLPEIAETWRTMKSESFEISPRDEVKYTFADDDPVRRELDEKGWLHSKRVPLMLDVLAGLPISLLTDTLVDYRSEARSPTDFYLDGLKWCLRRFAMQVEEERGLHWVVVDMPSRPKDLKKRDVSVRLEAMYKNVGTAPFDLYDKYYWKSEPFGFFKARGKPYRDCNLVPTLTAAHARHSDLLQIADVIVGCVRDFCHHNLSEATDDGELPPEDWRDHNMRRILPIFRQGPRGVSGYGFDVFPNRHPARDSLISWVNKMSEQERS